MRLSELIAKLQRTMDEKGDVEHVALGLVVGRTTKSRLDAFGDIDVVHDTAQYPNGVACLVAEYAEPPREPLAPEAAA